MPGVALVTDSTAYLPPDLVERHGIQVVPLYVVFGGDRTVPETEITDYPAFFDELRTADALPTTSQPSVGDFVSAYEPLLQDGGGVISIHISGGLSGTPEAARRPARRWKSSSSAWRRRAASSRCGSRSTRSSSSSEAAGSARRAPGSAR